MKCAVKLYVAGKVFEEIVYAVNYDDARKTAISRNPTARIIGVNVKYWYVMYYIINNIEGLEIPYFLYMCEVYLSLNWLINSKLSLRDMETPRLSPRRHHVKTCKT